MLYKNIQLILMLNVKIVDLIFTNQNLLNTVRSKSNCAPVILKQERYPVF